MRIRGIFLKDYVEVVRNTPDLDWDSFLTEADWEIVRSPMIIPTNWYPVEVMAHIGQGIFEMRSKRNYEVVRMAGRARATEHFDDTTKKFLLKNDPVASLKAYTMIILNLARAISRRLRRMDALVAGSLSRAEYQSGVKPGAEAEFLAEDEDGKCGNVP